MLISGVPYKSYTYTGREGGWVLTSEVVVPHPIKYIKIDFTISDPNFPHQCPKCSGPAYVGFNSIQCKAKC